MPYQNTPNQVNETPGTKYYCNCGESSNKPYCDGSHETFNTGKTPAQVEIAEAKRVAICDCGKTGTSPFCDGSHSKLNHAKEPKMNINDVIHHYEKSLNVSDTESILQLYGKDPIFMPQHAPAQVGRDQVRAAYGHVFDTIKLNIKFTVYEIEEFGDLAYVRTSSAGKTTIRDNDEIVNEGNNELFVFRKEDGDWKIHRYIFSTTNPLMSPVS